MFCGKCGAQISEDTRLCPECGEMVSENQTDRKIVIENTERNNTMNRNMADNAAPMSTKSSSTGVSCPNCNSRNLHVTTENNTTSSGGGYSGGKGCLGFLLFGPLGLLCGSCGSKTTTTTTNKTFWVCQDCGNKFRNTQELMEESRRQYKVGLGGGIFFAVMTAFILAVWPFARADVGKSMDGFFIVFGLFCGVLALCLIALGLKSKNDYIAAKAQHEKNQSNANR